MIAARGLAGEGESVTRRLSLWKIRCTRPLCTMDVEAPDTSDPGSGFIIRSSRLPIPDIVEAGGTEPKLNSASAIRRTHTFVHRCGVQIAFVIVQERFVLTGV